jgi:hypothetical protein
MKIVMKYFKTAGALLLLITVIILPGCTKDSNSSTDSPTRDSFVGTWLVSPTKSTYFVTISADPNSTNGVFISEFAHIGPSFAPAGASVNGSKITLDANQVIGTDWTINGSGVLSGNTIKWNYTILAGGDLLPVAETYTRQ